MPTSCGGHCVIHCCSVQAPDWDAWRIRQASGDSGPGAHRTSHHVHSLQRKPSSHLPGGIAEGKVQVSWPSEGRGKTPTVDTHPPNTAVDYSCIGTLLHYNPTTTSPLPPSLPPYSPQIYISNKWGFTKWTKEQYKEMMEDGRLVPDGVSVQYKPPKGPLSEWKKRQTA